MDDIYQISVYKSRTKFQELQEKIRTSESNILKFNYVWLVGVGIVMLLISVYTAMSEGTPLVIYLAMQI